MNHYICIGGCKGASENPGVCGAETCPRHGKPLHECECEDGNHFHVFGIPRWKEIIKFFAGFQTAHFLFHAMLNLSSALPLDLNLGIMNVHFTYAFNTWAVVVNGIILLILLYFGYKKE